MSTVNEVRLIGNVGHDIEVNVSEKGGKAGVFSIAVNDYFTDSKGESITRVNWFRACVYGKVLEAVEPKINKGVRVMILGELKTREYTNREGQKVQLTEVVCSQLYVLQ